MSARENWYIVSRPFTVPTVDGPLPDKIDALAEAETRAGRYSRKVQFCDGEVWVAGMAVVNHHRLKINGWSNGIKTELPTQLRKTEGRWGRS